jgi:hypothetical protein
LSVKKKLLRKQYRKQTGRDRARLLWQDIRKLKIAVAALDLFAPSLAKGK